MTHPHRLMLLSAGWLLAAMAAAVLAHAESGRSDAPASECPKCPVCPAVLKVITPSTASGIPVKTEIPADSNTPVCNPSQFYSVIEYPAEAGTVSTECLDMEPGYKKLWKCVPKQDEFKAYLASQAACATGFSLAGANPISYNCVGADTSTAFTCLEGYATNGNLITASSGAKYYKCQSESAVCGPNAKMTIGMCCVAY